MKTNALDYHLPESLIATQPAEPRDSARLLVLHRDIGKLSHHRVSDLPKLGLFSKGDLMLVNQTRVIKAYLSGIRKDTGGKITGLFIAADKPGQWRVMLESRGTLQTGEVILLGHDETTPHPIELVESLGGGTWLVKTDEADASAVLERIGTTPLPPYIRKQRRKLGLGEVTDEDNERYNTVFAGHAGSVAAPTAGLHFTDSLLDQLDQMGIQRAEIDLHVGLGTFAPVRSENLEDHAMHAESFSVPRTTLDVIQSARANGNRLFVVGTTTVRALESLPKDALEPGAYPAGVTAVTNLFIQPNCGFDFQYTETLMTNFHLPKSTLIALVASLPGIGLERLLETYRTAVDEGYRFYSYGDAMLIV